ncbi:MAG: hypothetical protein PGN11_08195 [Quadrisphaera sp.]
MLQRRGLLDAAHRGDVERSADDLARTLRAGCLATVEPEPASIFDHVYAEPHPGLEEERAAFTAWWAGDHDEGARA